MAKPRNTYFVTVASTWDSWVDVLELFKYHLQVYSIPPYLSPATSLIDPRDEDYIYYGHPPVRGQQPIDYITIDKDDDDDVNNSNGQWKMDMPSASTTATQKAGGPQIQLGTLEATQQPTQPPTQQATQPTKQDPTQPQSHPQMHSTT